MKRFGMLFALSMLSLLLFGCGGGGKTTVSSANSTSKGAGRASIKIKWPAPPAGRLIYDGTKSITITLTNASTSNAPSQTFDNPGNGTQQTMTFTNLVPGKWTVTATAYSLNAVNGGPPAVPPAKRLSSGTTVINVAASSNPTVFDIDMQSAIDHIDITGSSSASLGSTPAVLTATPKNTDGAMVLTEVGAANLQWSVTSGASFASIPASSTGASVTVSGNATGDATITVTETKSGKQASFVVHVVPPGYGVFGAVGVPGTVYDLATDYLAFGSDNVYAIIGVGNNTIYKVNMASSINLSTNVTDSNALRLTARQDGVFVAEGDVDVNLGNRITRYDANLNSFTSFTFNLTFLSVAGMPDLSLKLNFGTNFDTNYDTCDITSDGNSGGYIYILDKPTATTYRITQFNYNTTNNTVANVKAYLVPTSLVSKPTRIVTAGAGKLFILGDPNTTPTIVRVTLPGGSNTVAQDSATFAVSSLPATARIADIEFDGTNLYLADDSSNQAMYVLDTTGKLLYTLTLPISTAQDAQFSFGGNYSAIAVGSGHVAAVGNDNFSGPNADNDNGRFLILSKPH